MKLNTLTDNSVQDPLGNSLSKSTEVTGHFAFPTQFGGGLTMQKSKLRVSVEYIQHNWEATGFAGNGFTSTNAKSYGAGVSYTLSRKTPYGVAEGMALYAGLSRQESYLIISGHQLITQTVSVGFSTPSKNLLHFYTAALKIGSRGEAIYPLVKENFVQFVFDFSFSGFFLKGGRKYD